MADADSISITAWLSASWPIFLGTITLVIVLAQMYTRIQVIEEKVRTLFSLINEITSRKK